MYYHVRIDYFDKHLKVNQTLIAFDYQHDYDIINKITEPYIREQDFIFKGVKLQTENIRQLQVYASEHTFKECSDYADQQIPSNVFMVYKDTDVLDDTDIMKNVTDEFINTTQNYICSMDTPSSKHTSAKPKKVFICHAGSNSNAANKIVTFLKLCGVPSDSIFCSSTLGNDFEVNENFVRGLHDLFAKHELFVIILHSNEFYSRPICLNEMGAAWATDSQVFSIILHGCDQHILKGVIRPDNIAIMVDKYDHAYKHLNDLRKQLSAFLAIDLNIEIDQWDNNRMDLLHNLQVMQPISDSKSQSSESKFTSGYGNPVPMAPNMNPNLK